MTTGPVNAALPERCHPYYQRRWRRRLQNRATYLGADEWYGQGQTYQLGPYNIRAATPGTTGYGQNTTLVLQEQNRLWSHEREKDYRYARRLRMAVYENVFAPQINTIAATVAKACRTLTLPPGLEYMESNMDRWGLDAATARMRRIAWAHVQGERYTLLEKPDGGPQPSRMHELSAGIRTYACDLDPLDFLDWRFDADGMELVWALIRVSHPAERSAPDEEQVEDDACVYTKLYKRSETPDGPGLWILYKDGVEVERGEGPSFVPIVVQFAVGQLPGQSEPVGLPINDDVTDLAELRFNKMSWLTDQEATHCFSQMWLKLSNSLSEEDERALGVHNYIGAEAMGFVNPSTDPMTHLINSMDRDGMTMRQMGGLETKGETSQAAKSGVALQLEQQNTSALFAMYASAAEAGERAIWQMAARMEGLDPEAVVVQYVRDFSALDAVSRFATVAQALREGGFAGEARAELQKQMFLAAHPDCEPESRARIFMALDAGAQAEEKMGVAEADAKLAAVQRLAKQDVPADDGMDMPDEATGLPVGVTKATPVPSVSASSATPDVVQATGATTGKAADVALNGAQVQALMEIVKAVANGEIPRTSGVAIISAGFPLSMQQAEQLVGAAGTASFEPEKSEPAPPFGAPPGDVKDDGQAVGQ